MQPRPAGHRPHQTGPQFRAGARGHGRRRPAHHRAEPRPHSWSQYKENCMPVALPFRALEWSRQWSAYYLSRWALLEVLEYLSVLSVLFAVIFYFTESGDRQKQKHYPAWQLVNTAQGDRKSTRLNSSHLVISYAVFCLK